MQQLRCQLWHLLRHPKKHKQSHALTGLFRFRPTRASTWLRRTFWPSHFNRPRPFGRPAEYHLQQKSSKVSLPVHSCPCASKKYFCAPSSSKKLPQLAWTKMLSSHVIWASAQGFREFGGIKDRTINPDPSGVQPTPSTSTSP